MILTTPEIAVNGYLITPFIALSALLFGIYGIVSNMFILEKKTKIIGLIWIIAAILNLSLNILSVPYIGILGAAIATLFAYTIAFIITLFYLKNFKLEIDFLFIIKSIISSIFISFLIILINPEGILNVSIVVGISAIIYLISILLLKGIRKEEIKFFKDILNNN